MGASAERSCKVHLFLVSLQQCLVLSDPLPRRFPPQREAHGGHHGPMAGTKRHSQYPPEVEENCLREVLRHLPFQGCEDMRPVLEEFGGQPDPQWPRSAAGHPRGKVLFITCLSPSTPPKIERPKIDKDTPSASLWNSHRGWREAGR